MFILDTIPLPVESIAITSPQKVAWLNLPTSYDIPQDWGPGQKTFALSGKIFLSEGGWAKIFAIDALKKRREPLLFHFGENSFLVQVADFNYHQSAGVITFDLDLIEIQSPDQFIFPPAPQYTSFDLSRQYAAKLRLSLTALTFLGIPGLLSQWLTTITTNILTIENLLKDTARLSQLPGSALAQLKHSAGLIISATTSLITTFEEFLTPFHPNREDIKQALLYARALRIQITLLFRSLLSLTRVHYYYVQKDDTLPRIAATLSRQFNTAISWQEIARANKIIDPGNITPGQPLLIPL